MLTLNAEFYPLGDAGRNVVGGYAEVAPHVLPLHLAEGELFPHHLGG